MSDKLVGSHWTMAVWNEGEEDSWGFQFVCQELPELNCIETVRVGVEKTVENVTFGGKSKVGLIIQFQITEGWKFSIVARARSIESKQSKMIGGKSKVGKKKKKRLKKNHLNYKRLTFFKYEKESFENESIK